MNVLLEALKISILPIFILLFIYMYALRPVQKKRKKLSSIVTNLKIDDKVVASNGIIGRIKKIDASTIIVETGSSLGYPTEITVDILSVERMLNTDSNSP